MKIIATFLNSIMDLIKNNPGTPLYVEKTR